MNFFRRFLTLYFLFYAQSAIYAATNEFEIEQVLFADSYLDGGSFSIVAITESKDLVYIYLSPMHSNERIHSDVVLINDKTILDDPNKILGLLDNLYEWVEETLSGSTIDSLLLEYKSDSDFSENQKKVLTTYGLLQEICIGYLVAPMFKHLSDSDVCQKILDQ